MANKTGTTKNVKKSRQTEEKKAPDALSKEFVEDSDDSSSGSDSDSSAVSAEVTTKTKQKSATKAPNDKRSKADAVDAKKKKKSSKNVQVTDSESSGASTSDSSSDSGSSSDSDSSSVSGSGSDSDSTTSSDASNTKGAKNDARVAQVADAAAEQSRRELFGSKTYANDFKPPSSFSVSDADAALPSKVQQLLSHENLQGKQLWHISAPAHVPISKLTSVTLHAIQKSEPVLSHKDVSYHFTASKSSQNASSSILTLSKGKYSSLEAVAMQQFHIVQDVSLPTTADHQDMAASSPVAQKRYSKESPPEQPNGLRMRFQPFGVVDRREQKDRKGGRKRLRPEASTELVHRSRSRDDSAARKAEKRARKEQRRQAKAAKLASTPSS